MPGAASREAPLGPRSEVSNPRSRIIRPRNNRSESPMSLDEATNPLTLGTPRALLPRPCVLVIFGAAGDLAWRKLMPAVYNLNVDGLLPSNFAVVGFGIGAKGDPEAWLR